MRPHPQGVDDEGGDDVDEHQEPALVVTDGGVVDAQVGRAVFARPVEPITREEAEELRNVREWWDGRRHVSNCRYVAFDRYVGQSNAK